MTKLSRASTIGGLIAQAVLELRNAAEMIDEEYARRQVRCQEAEDWRALADRMERFLEDKE